MGARWRSFAFLFLFLVEWPLCECLPYAGDRGDDTPEAAKKDISVHSLASSTSTRNADMSPQARTLVRVVTIVCTALSVALVCGIAASYVIYLLGRDEEREQLAALYDNITIPPSEEEDEAPEGGRPGESGDLLSGHQGELAEFINSVIRSKRRERLEGAGSESE